MSSESQNNLDNQEIDLSQISKKIGGFLKEFRIKFLEEFSLLKETL